MKKGTFSRAMQTFVSLAAATMTTSSMADVDAKQVDVVIPVGIVAPTAQDVQTILQHVKDPETKIVNGVNYTLGEIGKHNVVIAISGMGKVNSAVATALMISNFHPQMMILSGSAGSINQSMKVGDVVISKMISATENIESKDQFNSNPINNQKLPVTYQVDKTILADAHTKDYIKKHPRVHMITGNIVTADAFPESSEVLTQLTNHKFDVIDMESSAFAQVAWMFNVPYLVVKGISDDAAKIREMYQQQGHYVPSTQAKAALPQAGLFVVNFIENISADDLIVFSRNAHHSMLPTEKHEIAKVDSEKKEIVSA